MKKETLGGRFRRLRHARGLIIEQVADLIGYSMKLVKSFLMKLFIVASSLFVVLSIGILIFVAIGAFAHNDFTIALVCFVLIVFPISFGLEVAGYFIDKEDKSGSS